MTITTTADTMTAVDLDRVRADTLRLLLSLAAVHDLPMPARIEFWNLTSGGVPYRSLDLHLDNDRPDQVARWADAIGATEHKTRTYRNDTGDEWTTVRASTPYRDDPDADWHTIDVRCTYDRHPARASAARGTNLGGAA